MKRKIWRFVVGVAIVASPLVTRIADPVKQVILSPYDIRWQESSDIDHRTQTIRVSNLGTANAGPILFELDVTPRAIADFKVAFVEDFFEKKT
jgi:hypothetical protein